MAYTSDKKPGALNQVSSLGDTNNLVVEQSGDVRRATITQLEAKIFDAKSALTTPTGTEVVVVRQTDDTLRQVPLDNIVPAGKITNAQVSDSAAIADSKLATISSAGKVSNSATTATSANTNNAIVARDGSGNFSAGIITASLAGNATSASSAAAWTTPRDLALTGDVTATLAAVDGTSNVSAAATLADTGVAAGTYNDNAAQVRPFTVDAKGRLTNVGSAIDIAVDQPAVTNAPVKKKVRLATTVNLVGTYSNGTAGVGATLVGSSPGALAVDGVAVVLGDRILVKDQTTTLQNGIYTVTQVGDQFTGVFNLTRATDADQNSDLGGVVVSVDAGTVNGGTTYTSTFKTTDTVGTTAQVWQKVAAVTLGIDQKTSSYTLVRSDEGRVIRVNSASSLTVTVPTNATVPFPIGSVIAVTRWGTGEVTLAGASGVTVRAADSRLRITRQYSAAALLKIAADEWQALGDLKQ
jgi:hypothetical protein